MRLNLHLERQGLFQDLKLPESHLFLSYLNFLGYPFFILLDFGVFFVYPFFILFLSSLILVFFLFILFLSFCLSCFYHFFILLAAKWIKIGFPRYKRQRAEEKCRILSVFILFLSFFYPPSCKMDQNWLPQVQKAKG